jgi:hypothetical protein
MRKFEATICPEDFATTAILYPLNYLSFSPGKQVSVNFTGHSRLHVEIDNTAFRVMKAWISKH